MLKINPNGNLQDQFQTIAETLFSKYELVVNGNSYDLVEVEFYYSSEETHKDPYAHGDEMQLTNGKWYFHGSGIDMTIGDGVNFGGILLRGMYSQSASEFISGPLRVAKEIFKQFGDVVLKEMQFGLRKRQTARILEEADFVASTRINLPNRADSWEYKDKAYRFLTRIGPKHGFAEKEKVANALRAKGIPVETINRIFEYKIIKEG